MGIAIRAGEFAHAIHAVRRAFAHADDGESVVAVEASDGRMRLRAQNSRIAAITDVPVGSGNASGNLDRVAIGAVESIAKRDPDVNIDLDFAILGGVRVERYEGDDRKEHESKTPLDHVFLNCEFSRFKIDVVHRAHGSFPDPPTTSRIVLDCQAARDAFSLLGDVHDDASNTWNYTGVLFEASGSGMATATAADGRRVGILAVPVKEIAGPVVVPSRLIRSISHVLVDYEGDVVITFDERLCCIDVGGVTYYAQRDTRAFPNLMAKIEKVKARGVDIGLVDRVMLRRCLEQAKITTDPGLDIVGVTIKSDPPNLVFSSQSSIGRSVITPTTATSMRCVVTIDPSFVIPVLKRLKDHEVRVIVAGDDALYLETPVFRYLLMSVVAR